MAKTGALNSFLTSLPPGLDVIGVCFPKYSHNTAHLILM